MKAAAERVRCPRCHQESTRLPINQNIGCIGSGRTAHTEAVMQPIEPQSDDPQTKESKR